MRDGKWKIHLGGKKGLLELYDLSTDPSESNNVAKKYPEVVSQMKKKVNSWVSELPKKYAKISKDEIRKKMSQKK